MSRYTVILLLAGVAIGVLAIGTIRFATLEPPPAGTHFHANFVLFVGGERIDLTAEKYMEDVGACKADEALVLPVERAHLHSRVPDVVHVHHKGVSWGHFFTNIGFTLGDDFLFTDTGERYFAGGGKTFKFFVNGAHVPTVLNRLIASEDKLLISYGTESEDEALGTQFPEIPSTAAAFNASHFDPGGCAGSEPAETTWDRVKRAFLF